MCREGLRASLYALFFCLVIGLQACGQAHRTSPYKSYFSPTQSFTGVASWYGKGFHGRRTANGEIYNMYRYTAAHKKLPLGTILRVKNLANGKSVYVRVNDRGPYIKGRDLDLSLKAAQALDFVRSGHTKVKFWVMNVPSL